MNSRWQGIQQYFARFRQNRALVFMALLLVMFVALAVVARSPRLLALDTGVTREIQEGHSTPLDFLAYFFTFLGNATTMTVLCVGAAMVLARTGRPKAALFSMLTLLGLPLNLLLKLIVHRPRPSASLVRILFPEPGPSFPSGHAMGSVIVYGFLAYLAWTFIRDIHRRRFWTAVLAITPIGISLSRIYIGVHWFSDIIGAWIFGLVVLLIFADLYKFVGAKECVPGTEVAPVSGRTTVSEC
jgi:membrane-associated phospholipid phosphatase